MRRLQVASAALPGGTMNEEARRPKDDEEDWDMAHDAPLGDADPLQAAYERLHGTRPAERPEPEWDW